MAKIVWATSFSLLFLGCASHGAKSEKAQPTEPAKSIAVYVPEVGTINVLRTQRSSFIDFKAGEISEAMKVFNSGVGKIVTSRTADIVATTLRKAGYEPTIVYSPVALKSAIADFKLAIVDFSVLAYAESGWPIGNKYRVVMSGRRMLETKVGGKFVDKQPLYYANMRTDPQGIVKAEAIGNASLVEEQFDKTIQGWVDSYIRSIDRLAE